MSEHTETSVVVQPATHEAGNGQPQLPYTRTIELRGHIIDSHILSQVMDLVMDHNAEFYIEQFDIGRHRLDPSYARLALYAATPEALGDLLEVVNKLGAQGLERDEADVTLGKRDARNDPMGSAGASGLFWRMYRRLVQPDVPSGGIDVFGCNQVCRDQLVALDEANSSLVGLLVWIGFRRAFVPYARQARKHGRSAWSFQRKLKYMVDSIYAFSDLPIRLLTRAGALSVLVAVVVGAVVLVQRLRGAIPVAGYTVQVLMIMFFGGLNAFGLGIVGGYVWRAHENTKRRPHAIVMSRREFGSPAKATPRELSRRPQEAL